MSDELKIQTSDGKINWFGRDDHFPEEVRVYGSDANRWSYMPIDEARTIVGRGLRQDGDVQQGDALRFFMPEAGEGEQAGDD